MEPNTLAPRKLIHMLPTEIHACIVDALDNQTDAGTIANCALVCRAWVPRCRSRKFQLDINVNSFTFEILCEAERTSRTKFGFYDRAKDGSVQPVQLSVLRARNAPLEACPETGLSLAMEDAQEALNVLQEVSA